MRGQCVARWYLRVGEALTKERKSSAAAREGLDDIFRKAQGRGDKREMGRAVKRGGGGEVCSRVDSSGLAEGITESGVYYHVDMPCRLSASGGLAAAPRVQTRRL